MVGEAPRRVALAHDWLLGMRGGERVLEGLCRLFPDAPIYTFLWEPGSVSSLIESHPIHTSWIDRLPGARRWHRALLPVLPLAADTLRVEPCDVLVSTSHCVAHGVRAPAGAAHLCVCFTPMRYAFGMESEYIPAYARPAWEALAVVLRAWDRRRVGRADRVVAISEYVRERIERSWGVRAGVVHPPVDVERFRPTAKPEDYFLVVSALVPYKRVDIAIDAFRGRSEELWIAGEGPLRRRLERSAPRSVRFLGRVSEEDLPGLVARSRALVFPTEDEFGVVPVEAQAAGRPVIALGRGGATETVVPPERGPRPTGLWFEPQTPRALAQALDRFAALEPRFEAAAIRAHALRFSPERFREGILAELRALRGQPTPFSRPRP